MSPVEAQEDGTDPLLRDTGQMIGWAEAIRLPRGRLAALRDFATLALHQSKRGAEGALAGGEAEV